MATEGVVERRWAQRRSAPPGRDHGTGGAVGRGSSLTERRMARTRRELAEAAGRLFLSQGYDTTTVEDIAAAADVSPRTFFRYFSQKEGVVVALAQFGVDDVLGGLRRRPPGEPTADALGAAVVELVERPGRSPVEGQDFFRLVRDIPALRARWLDEVAQQRDELAEVLAARMPTGGSDDDARLAARVAAGAVLGAITVAFEEWAAAPPGAPLGDRVRRALAVLERPVLGT